MEQRMRTKLKVIKAVYLSGAALIVCRSLKKMTEDNNNAEDGYYDDYHFAHLKYTDDTYQGECHLRPRFLK